MSLRLILFAAATAIVILTGIAEAQGTFALHWNSCAPGAPSDAPVICGDGVEDVLVATFTPDVAMTGAVSLLAVFEIKTSGDPAPPVPNYLINGCLLSSQFFTHATCLVADRLLATGNTCLIAGVETPVNGDPSRVRFRVLANRPVGSPKALVAGHAYQAFALRFPDMDPAEPDCEGCDVPFHVFVVEHMVLRGVCPPPTPIFLTNGGSPCVAGNQTCAAPAAVEGPSGGDPFHLSCAPNPTGGWVRLSYELSSSSDVDLFVADLAGRAVRRLESGTRPRGAYSLTWDGRDDTGRRVAAGVYWLTLRAQGRRSAVRLVMSR